MDDAGLDDRPGPDLTDRVGQALEPVADEHQDILDSAVLQIGKDPKPVLGALASLASCPQSEDVAVALRRDRQRNVDRAVGDLAVTDLHVDAVDEQDRVDAVERAGLPLGHALDHRVGDR